jgi:hypothetical protein
MKAPACRLNKTVAALRRLSMVFVVAFMATHAVHVED